MCVCVPVQRDSRYMTAHTTLTIFVCAFMFPSFDFIVLWLDDGTYTSEALEIPQLAFASGWIYICLIQDVVAVPLARYQHTRNTHLFDPRCY